MVARIYVDDFPLRCTVDYVTGWIPIFFAPIQTVVNQQGSFSALLSFFFVSAPFQSSIRQVDGFEVSDFYFRKRDNKWIILLWQTWLGYASLKNLLHVQHKHKVFYGKPIVRGALDFVVNLILGFFNFQIFKIYRFSSFEKLNFSFLIFPPKIFLLKFNSSRFHNST